MVVELTVEGRIARITLDIPPMNAFRREDLVTFRDIQRDLADHDPAAVVLTGHGKAFSVGADVTAFAEWAEEGTSRDHIRGLVETYHDVIWAIESSPVPWVAAVNGTAAGGGIGLAAACDISVVHPSATLVPGYPLLGLAPDGGLTHHARQRMGDAKARWWLLSNEPMSGDEAVGAGLLSCVHQSPDQEAERLAVLAGRWPSHTSRSTRELLGDPGLRAALDAELEAMVLNAGRPEHAEGVRAFVERREPRW